MKRILLTTITLLISSGISIAQDKWQNTATNNFYGDTYNKAVTKMHVFKGQIYAGTGSSTGEVYRSSTGHPDSWINTFTAPFVQSIDDINSTAEGGGYIYVSGYANGSDIPRISRSADGSTWVPYYEGTDKLPFVFPFKGTGSIDSIYIVREVYPFSMILKSAYDSNDPTNTSNTFDTVFTTPSFVNIASYTIHNNKIYVGTNNTGKIWISSANGNSWQQDTLFQPGFGNANNYTFSAMTSFGGYLYVGTENSTDGAQIWRSNNDTTWTNVATFPGANKVTSLNNLSGNLWVTLESSTKGKILKSANGTTYVFSDSVGFGVNGNDGMRGSTVLFGNHIYYGYENYYSGAPQMTQSPDRTGSGVGGQVWRHCLGVLPAVDLGLDQTVCEGISVTFDAGGGHAGYEWSNETTAQTISTTDPGHYTVLVTGANGCQNKDSVRLINTPAPTLNLTSPEGTGPYTLCKNDTMDITLDALSNLRDPLVPINKPTFRQISNSLGTTYDTIAVNGINDYAADALYSVTIDSLYHVYDGDVTLSLQAPDGSFITLAASIGGGGQNYMGTVFTKSGTNISAAAPPFTGSFMPFDPFTNLSGNVNGLWILRMDDSYSSDDGTLKGWTIRFSKQDTIMTYSWTPATGLTATNKLNVKAIGTNFITYTLTTSNTIGCSTTTSVDVSVPKMQVASSSVTACYGDSVQISATGGSTYDWSPATGLSNTTNDTVFASPTVTKTYYVTDTVDGCVITDSVVVNANSQVVVNAGGVQATCFGNPATLNGMATGGTQPYTYLWNDGSTTFSLQNPVVSPTANATYILTVTDASGCTGIDTAFVNVNPLPTVSVSPLQSVCLGNSATISGTAASGTTPYTYLWDDGSTTYSVSGVSVSPISTTTYTLTVSDSNACTAAASTVVNVNLLPVADAGSSQAICLGSSATVSGSATDGTPAYTYLWNDGSTTYTLQNILVSPTINTTYSLTVSDASGCTGTDTVMVTINMLPVADAGLSQTICFSAKDTLNGLATGGTVPYTYLWSSGATTYPTQSAIVEPAVTTTYTLTVTDNNGCSGSDSVTIMVIPSTNIYGHVNYSGGNLTNGNVVLYEYLPYQTHFDTVQVASLNGSGDYMFAGVDYGNYLVKVFANVVAYPNAVPTYYGDQSLWNALPSQIVYHSCTATDTLDITLIEMPVLTGPGRLSGTIIKGPGFGNSEKWKGHGTNERSDPIPGVDVKLGKNPGGSANIVGQTETDSNGDYTFTSLPLNLPGESYVVFVDIPGLGRDSSYVVVLDINDSVIVNLDYIADSTIIYIPDVSTGIENPYVATINTLSIYPNPSAGIATIEYFINDDAGVSLGIYNVLGVKMVEIAQGYQQAGSYRYIINTKKNNLSKGVYFVTLNVDDKISIRKIIITE